MYKWLEAVLKEQYQFIRCLRRTARSEVILLEHKNLHCRIIKRTFTGNAEVYRRLLLLKQKNMPEILEVAENENRVLVLVRKLVCELCDVLSLIHSYDIIHKDIKA